MINETTNIYTNDFLAADIPRFRDGALEMIQNYLVVAIKIIFAVDLLVGIQYTWIGYR